MTRTRGRTTETHTIQLWPGGQSIEYRGDPDGPANQRSLRAGHYQARIRCARDCRRTWIEDGAIYMQGHATPLSSVFVHADDDPRAGKYCIGDPVNYPERVSLCSYCHGEGYIDNPVKNPWRKGTREEWRQVRIEIRAELYQRNYILACQSSLVDDRLKEGERDGWTVDDIENMYIDPSDWDADRCREYASDHGIELPEVDPCAEHETWQAECPACAEMAEDDGPRGWLTEARDACREHAQDNPNEAYEWWLVDGWLCKQLRAIGEIVIDNGYGTWWGRGCTGQGLIMDGTLQRIAAQYEEDRP